MGKRLQNVDQSQTPCDPETPQRPQFPSGMWQKLNRLNRLFFKEDPSTSPVDEAGQDHWPQLWSRSNYSKSDQPRIGLPRQATFKRQNSERREHLLPVEPGHAERRAHSSTRQVSTSLPRPRSTSSPPSWGPGRLSAPSVVTTSIRVEPDNVRSYFELDQHLPDPPIEMTSEPPWSQLDTRPDRPPSVTSSDDSHYASLLPDEDGADMATELDSRWILNLSMHFRDKSDREKFFVTYAQSPNHWRRVTVSCDYRGAEAGSLEMDLKELQFQRDKSSQIYESIRDSLPEIQFYDTVTNLKLQTTEGRLHVHVTEDVNEIIPYPRRHTVARLLQDGEFSPMEVRESDLEFDSHLSGFVYKVRYQGKIYIKKEIPGPDTVDEFLYEINALHALHDSNHVIHLEAIVMDDGNQFVKGLLITYAERGAVVDLLYDHKGNIPWVDRCNWAEDAVRGLSEIHGEGYVQGDFTLSNIVVNADNRAQIIDINRRGCPVGWEPPEIATKIAGNQRISMYIGEKSDIYQLGMTLWALAMDDDEPERQPTPLSVEIFPSDVPEWYQEIVRNCLSPRPRDRLSAKELAILFQNANSTAQGHHSVSRQPRHRLTSPEYYIDPAHAVERDDIEKYSLSRDRSADSHGSSRVDLERYTFPKSSSYEFDSQSSAYERPRGRQPPTNVQHLDRRERRQWAPRDDDTYSIDDQEPNIVDISPGMDRELYDEIEVNGHPYLVSRGTFSTEELQILERHTDNRQHAVDERDGVPTEPNPAISERRPSLQTHHSINSDTTPRGSRALLPTFSHSNHKSLPPKATMDHASIEASLAAHEMQNDLVSYLPPQLPYNDSGYDEPSLRSLVLDRDDCAERNMPSSDPDQNVSPGSDVPSFHHDLDESQTQLEAASDAEAHISSSTIHGDPITTHEDAVETVSHTNESPIPERVTTPNHGNEGDKPTQAQNQKGNEPSTILDDLHQSLTDSTLDLVKLNNAMTESSSGQAGTIFRKQQSGSMTETPDGGGIQPPKTCMIPLKSSPFLHVLEDKSRRHPDDDCCGT